MKNIFAWQRAMRDSPELDATARLVGFVLATYMDKDGRCYPGQARLAEGIGRSVATVRRGLRTLEAAGFLVTQRGGRGTCNRYRGVIPRTERP